MAAGPKTELVAFTRESRTPDGYGGYARSVTTVGELWAEVKPQRATEAERAGSLREMTVYLLTCHAEAVRALGIDHTTLATWNGRKLNVREVRLGASRTADCDIVAEFGVAQ